MQIAMRCRTKPHEDEMFTLVCERGYCWLFDVQGEVVLTFPLAEIGAFAQFPSFSDSIKYFSLMVDGKQLAFYVDGGDLKELRKAGDSARAAEDPGYAASLRRKGWLQVIGGLAAIVGGPLLSYISYIGADSAGDSYFVFYGLSILGLAVLVKGIVVLRRAGRVKKRRMGCEPVVRKERP